MPGFNVADLPQGAHVRRSRAFRPGDFVHRSLHRFPHLVETRLVRLAVMVGEWKIPPCQTWPGNHGGG